ncbi:MAG: HAD-IC family P-type ATPase [Candidatus Eremiobacteraeota bacterium]|nr:HAD-IC family P-type ATPase [Candidatus Eremiobacteraeota bacterium]
MSDAPGEEKAGSAKDTPWHGLAVEKVLALLGASGTDGLSPEEAGKRLLHYGANEVPRGKRKSLVVLFLSQFTNPLVIVLIASALVTVFLKHPVDALVIGIVILANAVIGFVQEERAENAIESLSKMLSHEARVIRGGALQIKAARELVPGDLVALESGDRIPADIRLTEVNGASVNESVLTGESLPVLKATAPSAEAEPVAERTSMAYSGTLLVAGSARGIVTATGISTEIGKISGLILQAPAMETPLTMKLKGLSMQLSVVVLIFCLVLFAVAMAMGHRPAGMFNASVAIAVALIPEGLPAVVTIILAVGVRRMAARNAIIRNLPSVETLGSVSVICSDKTGTLTTNEMTVKHVSAGGRHFELGGIGYNPRHCCVVEEGEHHKESALPGVLLETLRCGLLCTTSSLEEHDGEWRAVGDPTEAALIAAAYKGGLTAGEYGQYPRVDLLPFDSSRMLMATLHGTPGGTRVIYAKGSVEQILGLCSARLMEKGEEALEKEEVLLFADERAALGYRVLAFARKELESDASRIDEKALGGFTFLGLQAMSDPARPEAVKAVGECLKAGIEVKMITGDHVATAKAIAHDLGMGGEALEAFTGTQLAALGAGEFDKAARAGRVFARVAPEQKYRLVESLQKEGKIIAMTGDGVNDAPALKKADIGVAMGRAGSDVTKDAADMVLADDNFATIVSAIEEGRTVFSNLRKSLAWILPTNLGEGLIIVAALLTGMTMPVTPVQILWINTVTAVTLGLPLAFEAMEKDIMTRPPRPREAPIIDKPMLHRIMLVTFCIVAGTFLIFELDYTRKGVTIEEARTAAVAAIVGFEIFYLFSARSERVPVWKLGLFSNPYVWIGVFLAVLLQLGFTYLPFMNALFGSAPLPAVIWLDVLLISFLVIPAVSAHKMLIARKARQEKDLPPLLSK